MPSLKGFSRQIENALSSVSEPAANWFREVNASPEMADAEAERRFPNEARDSSVNTK